jgi:spermidine synthase
LEPPQGFDVLVLDAFSGDAIPVHLLTQEAFAVWRRHIGPGGILAVHITNRYLDLKPVLRTIASEQGLSAVHIPSYERGARWSSDWMLLARDAAVLRDEVIDAASLPVLRRPDRVLWTDQWSDLLRILKR